MDMDEDVTDKIERKIEEGRYERRMPGDLAQMMENVVNSYDDVIDAFQKETIQNSLDGYNDNIREWTRDIRKPLVIQFIFNPEERTMCWKDNAGGMDKDTWDNYFHGLGKTTKTAEINLGFAGQGLSLINYLGEYVVTQTKHGDFSNSKVWKEDKIISENLEDVPELDENGIRCLVKNVKEDFIESLCDIENIERLIQRTWDKILREDNIMITYRVERGDGESMSKEIEAVDLDKCDLLIDQEWNLKCGDVSSKIYFCEEGKPPFTGIGINVKDQTIKWYNPMGISHTDRIIGWVDAPFLHDSVKSTHEGFRNTSEKRKVEKKIKRELKRTVNEEIQESAEISDKTRENMEEARDIFNEALARIDTSFEFIPGLEGTSGEEDDVNQETPGGPDIGEPEGKGKEEKPEKEEPDHPNISLISTAKRDFSREDTVVINLHVKNPTSASHECDLTVKIEDPEGDTVKKWKDNTKLVSEQEKAFNAPYDIPEDAEKGRYKVKGYLENNSYEDSRSTYFRVETEPEPRHHDTPAPTKKGLESIKLARWGESEDTSEFELEKCMYDPDDNVVYIHPGHPGWKYAMDKKRVSEYSYECVLDACIKRRMENLLEGLEDDVKDSSDKIEDIFEVVDIRDKLSGFGFKKYLQS